MGPISASFGDHGIFCAIDASGHQEIICWGDKTNASASQNPSIYSVRLPPMAALTGGEGFLCGLLANTSQAFCWEASGSNFGLVPDSFKLNAYFHIAAGKNHVCAIRGSYFADNGSGSVDCWDIVRESNRFVDSRPSSQFSNQHISMLVFEKLVSGDGFSCGVVREGGIQCWGPNVGILGNFTTADNLIALASGNGAICGVKEVSRQVKCWGDNHSFGNPPTEIHLVSLAAGAEHFCGIREDNHGIECWGNFNSTLVPKGSGFLAIASTDFVTCGIRETDLVIDCWFSDYLKPVVDYDPPLQLCSPGLCTPGSCGEDRFAFNASFLNEPDLTSLCTRKGLSICSHCGLDCSEGFFLSSPCSANADRVCTACSLCQNSSCWDVCRLQSSSQMHQKRRGSTRQLLIIVVSSTAGVTLILICWYLLPFVIRRKFEDGKRNQFGSCIGTPELENGVSSDPNPLVSAPPFPGIAQVFRLSELKDATSGFKEFNELGRGSYGFVYKAVLADGRQVAVKRANAATIIHTTSRDFEMGLEVLCSISHSNIVNLLGYCTEMGERLLVYEFMSHGTLQDHLHGGLSPLSWTRRLKIAMQAAKGLDYLHREVVPPIAHRDLKSSKILLDCDWVARIADFAVLAPSESEISQEIKTDVYNFGIVLLEILSGRKPYDSDAQPSSIVQWALPIIKQGRAAAVIDRYTALPRNVEPLLKLADIAEFCLREDQSQRPSMAEVALFLEHLVKEGLVL